MENVLTHLDEDQKRAVQKFVKHRQGIAWWRMGLGKTRIALTTFAILQFKPPAICVVVCRRAAFYDWQLEVKKIGLDFRCVEFNPEQPKYAVNRPTLWFTTHAMLGKHLPYLQLNPHLQFAIYDELYLYSNCRSQRTKAAIQLSKTLDAACIGLSGTIMPARDNTSVWGQSSTIGNQKRLARNLTEFRGRYQNTFNLDFGEGKCVQHTNKLGSENLILSRLGDTVDFNFPKKNERKIYDKITPIAPTDEQKRIITQLKDEYYTELSDGTELELDSALSLVIKIQQIANGWVRLASGKIQSVASNKLSALISSIQELLAEGEKCIVWCAFKRDVEMVCTEAPFATLQMQGGKEFDIEAWERGDANVVVATEGSGSSVNHFAQVGYAKYFSQSFKWLDLQQSKGRTDRKDSKHRTCHYEFFHVVGSLDSHVHAVANSSGKLETELIQKGVLRQWLMNKTFSDFALV